MIKMIFNEYTKKAYDMALIAHEGQVDKAGNPYMEHVISVASKMTSTEATCVALLHDVLEDSGIFTLEQIYDAFGSDVGYAVNLLTRRKGEKYWSYIKNLATDDLARTVKIADLKDNCRLERFKNNTIPDDVVSLIKDRYEPALAYLIGIEFVN